MNSFASKRILVVDDSETMRMFILLHLIKLLPGVKITEAVNGADAIDKLKGQDVDLILTDMNMPVMDGAGVITAVRKDLKMTTPIIVLTTMGEQKDRARGIELGASDYITKPINVREFRDTILKNIAWTTSEAVPDAVLRS